MELERSDYSMTRGKIFLTKKRDDLGLGLGIRVRD